MATWEDGPEYAPIQRPDHFAAAAVAPLEEAPPRTHPSPGVPVERPRFSGPTDPAPPLAALIPPVAKRRDPQMPFDVVSSTATEASSAWSAVHWTPPGADPGAGPALTWTPPSAPPWPGETGTYGPRPGEPVSGSGGNGAVSAAWPAAAPMSEPLGPHGGPSAGHGPYPTPGTPQWFTPPPPPVAPGPPVQVGVKDIVEAATPGVLICLLVGGLIYPLAPAALAVAFGLVGRMTVERARARAVLATALGVLAFIGLIALLAADQTIGEWWVMLGRWGQVFSWVSLVIVLVVLYHGLKERPAIRRDGPHRWG